MQWRCVCEYGSHEAQRQLTYGTGFTHSTQSPLSSVAMRTGSGPWNNNTPKIDDASIKPLPTQHPTRPLTLDFTQQIMQFQCLELPFTSINQSLANRMKLFKRPRLITSKLLITCLLAGCNSNMVGTEPSEPAEQAKSPKQEESISEDT